MDPMVNVFKLPEESAFGSLRRHGVKGNWRSMEKNEPDAEKTVVVS